MLDCAPLTRDELSQWIVDEAVEKVMNATGIKRAFIEGWRDGTSKPQKSTLERVRPLIQERRARLAKAAYDETLKAVRGGLEAKDPILENWRTVLLGDIPASQVAARIDEIAGATGYAKSTIAKVAKGQRLPDEGVTDKLLQWLKDTDQFGEGGGFIVPAMEFDPQPVLPGNKPERSRGRPRGGRPSPKAAMAPSPDGSFRR